MYINNHGLSLGCLCGVGVTGSMKAFQAFGAGSTPVCRLCPFVCLFYLRGADSIRGLVSKM